MTFVSGKTLPRINRVNALKRKNFLRAPVPMVSSSEADRSIVNKAGFRNE